MERTKEFHLYRGAIHIHSKLSDGTGDVRSIVKAAKRAGLDWIIVTDHNHYDTDEGIIDGIYVIKGQEISPQDNNHYLTIGVEETIEYNDNPQIYIDKVRQKGGFGFAAHPDEGHMVDDEGNVCLRKNSHHCITWTDKNIKPDGIEIWNWFSNWADNLDDSNIFSLAYAYLFKHNIIKNPSKITLDWWDNLNNNSSGIVPAIGGVDAHALKFYKYIIPVTVFPYETCFSTITNIINLPDELANDFNVAKEQIFRAIKQGNNMIANLHTAKNIPNIFVTNAVSTYYCGEELELDSQTSLHFESNKPMEVCLIYNGNELKRFTSDKFEYPIENSGKYRIEVSVNGKGFLYTNPFNVKEKIITHG